VQPVLPNACTKVTILSINQAEHFFTFMTENLESFSRRCHFQLLRFTVTLALVFFFSPISRADRLDDMIERGTLIWGADEEGGGPYIFHDPNDGGKLKGFEVELANEIASELSKRFKTDRPIQAKFKQAQWETIPSLVDKGDADIALNGFELTPERQLNYLCSRPYYVYAFQLMARGDLDVSQWKDLRSKPGRKFSIGVLGGTAAQKYAESWNDALNVSIFDGTTQALNKVRDGSFNLTLLDDCAAIYWAEQYPTLKFVGRPEGQGFYVALIKQGETRLHEAINAALTIIIKDGRLQTIYDRWDMSGKAQMLSLRDTGTIDSAKRLTFFEIMRDNFPLLIEAAGMTVLLSCASMPLAIVVGILVAIGRLYGPATLRFVLACYVEFVRGTPLMLQLFAIFYLFPYVGINFEPIFAGIIGLAINYSAYEAEIYRAGFQAIPRGQMEAAVSLGMTQAQAIRRIILPQAFRIVIPPVTNDFIALFKDTSVCSAITIVELTKRYSIQANSTGAIVQIAILTSILYLLMSYPLSLLARYSERKLGGQPKIA
jgi:polar amino acid transport system substrate-binding protein